MANEHDLRRLRGGEMDLSGCDFTDAELQDADLTDRDFTRADFTGAHLNGADLRSSVFKSARFKAANLNDTQMDDLQLATLNLSDVIFENASLQRANLTGTQLRNCDFTKADLSGARFTNCTIHSGNKFASAIVDDVTDFSGAQTMRSVANDPFFRDYELISGRLRRRHKVGDAPLAGLGKLVPRTREGGHEPPIKTVAETIAERPRDIQNMAAALAIAIRDQIAELAERKPNDAEHLEKYNSYVRLLTSLSDGLEEFTENLETYVAKGDPAAQQAAADLLIELNRAAQNWLMENSALVADGTVRIGLIGVSCAFLTFCGVEPWGATILPGIVFGTDKVRDWLSRTRQKGDD